jgi:glycosyltransferase involved in cell wall biosynthesis
MERKTLAICIPTYNRIEKLLPRIQKLLSNEDSRFCVVIKDNCSSDATRESLEKISDSRLIYIRNEENVGGVRNPWLAMQEGSNYADFIALCLDKDRIKPENLSKFLDFLVKEKPQVGYAELNMNVIPYNQYINLMGKSFSVMSYIFKHPSGYFFGSNSFVAALNEIINEEKIQIFPFIFDVVAAHVSANNYGYIYSMPLVYTETRDETSKIKSYTYNADNLYFAPKFVQYEFPIYLRDLFSLPIDKKLKYKKALFLLHHMLLKVSLTYKYIMSNEKLCMHHGIKTQKIGYFAMIKNLSPVVRCFNAHTKDNISLVSRCTFILLDYLYVFMKLSINAIRN